MTEADVTSETLFFFIKEAQGYGLTQKSTIFCINSRSHLIRSGPQKDYKSDNHTENSKILGAKVQYFFSRTTWPLGFVHPWTNSIRLAQ